MREWHIITCEYPPQIGGVSSYVASVARGLGAAGYRVHVWCPGEKGLRPQPTGVTVHGDLGRFRPSDLRRVGRALDQFPAPRRLLIQWVPHGYGYRSMNLPFCYWLRRRARQGDVVDLMVHEAFLSFSGSWRQKTAAAVHRMMTVVLLSAARKAWISIPAWRSSLEPYTRGKSVPFEWLPVPSPIEPVEDPSGVAGVRARYAPRGAHLIGHFGTYSRLTAKPMKALVLRLLPRTQTIAVLLMGQGSEKLRQEIAAADPLIGSRVHASGPLSPEDLSRHIQACDLLVQPYPDGITSRRTSAMASLAHGKAMVTSHGRSSEPLWQQYGAVSLVPLDPLLLAAEIERLLKDDAARRLLGERARKLYDDFFSVRRTIETLTAS